LPSPLLIRGSGAVAGFIILGMVDDVHDVPALAPWPEINERDVECHKRIHGHTEPFRRLFAVQVFPGWD